MAQASDTVGVYMARVVGSLLYQDLWRYEHAQFIFATSWHMCAGEILFVPRAAVCVTCFFFVTVWFDHQSLTLLLRVSLFGVSELIWFRSRWDCTCARVAVCITCCLFVTVQFHRKSVTLSSELISSPDFGRQSLFHPLVSCVSVLKFVFVLIVQRPIQPQLLC